MKTSSAGLTDVSMFEGSIGFAFSMVAFALPPLLLASLCIGGGFVSGFFDAAGDLPVSGVFSGSVCACNPKANAIDKQKSETKIDFFIRETNPKRSRLSSNLTVGLLTELTEWRKWVLNLVIQILIILCIL